MENSESWWKISLHQKVAKILANQETRTYYCNDILSIFLLQYNLSLKKHMENRNRNNTQDIFCNLKGR